MSTDNNNDWGSWIGIVILFCIPCTWPIALFLLYRKLSGTGDKNRRTARHPYDIQREQQSFAQSQNPNWNQRTNPSQPQSQNRQTGPVSGAAQAKAAPPKPQPPKNTKQTKAKKGTQPKLSNKGKWMTTFGGILSGFFAFTSAVTVADALPFSNFFMLLRDLIPQLGFFCLGLVLMYCGFSRTRKGRRYRKYLALIGRRESVPIDSLSKAAGVSRRKLLDDLQDMLDAGLLPAGYLDMGRDLLVLSDEGIPVDFPEPAAAPEPEKKQDDDAILREIRQVNDAIPGVVMSQKIDRIEEITSKILEYQRKNPGKESQLRSFLGYYLPTTLKILRAYAQLDAQGVEGENISAAKARIEGMMDKVVEGFEKQLDKLFQDSAMDISSDVSVLEQMLEKDGLSSQGQGMTLGG